MYIKNRRNSNKINNNKIIKTMNRIQISLYKLIVNTEN